MGVRWEKTMGRAVSCMEGVEVQKFLHLVTPMSPIYRDKLTYENRKSSNDSLFIRVIVMAYDSRPMSQRLCAV